MRAHSRSVTGATGLASEERVAHWVTAGLSLFVVTAVAVVIFGSHGGSPGDARASLLPTVNAILNGTSALLLIVGYVCIRRGSIAAHKTCMLTAFTASSLFLITYLVHHHRVGSVPFAGHGWVRAVYFAVLIPHVTLSAMVVPLALTTIRFGWQSRFSKHVPLARWTLPIWLYVSVSGVVVYWMLYHLTR